MSSLDKPCIESFWRTKNPDGYYSVNPKNHNGYYRLHRYLYAKHYNIDLTSDQEIQHLCHNASCIEITHLELATHKENMVAMKEAKRGRGKSRFTEDDIREIRRLYFKTNKTQVEIARRFNTSKQQINRIINRKRWGWLK